MFITESRIIILFRLCNPVDETCAGRAGNATFLSNKEKTLPPICTEVYNFLLLHRRPRKYIPSLRGEMVEWSITAVLKTAVLQGTGGSNPSLSAET